MQVQVQQVCARPSSAARWPRLRPRAACPMAWRPPSTHLPARGRSGATRAPSDQTALLLSYNNTQVPLASHEQGKGGRESKQLGSSQLSLPRELRSHPQASASERPGNRYAIPNRPSARGGRSEAGGMRRPTCARGARAAARERARVCRTARRQHRRDRRRRRRRGGPR